MTGQDTAASWKRCGVEIPGGKSKPSDGFGTVKLDVISSTKESYQEDILPGIKDLATSKNEGVKRQSILLLGDKEGYWLSLKGKK